MAAMAPPRRVPEAGRPFRLDAGGEDEFCDLESPFHGPPPVTALQAAAPTAAGLSGLLVCLWSVSCMLGGPDGWRATQEQLPKHSAWKTCSGVSVAADEKFSRQWLMGSASDRAHSRPKDWNGKKEGFDTFAFREPSQWSSLPGNAEELLEANASHSSTIVVSEFGFRVW